MAYLQSNQKSSVKNSKQKMKKHLLFLFFIAFAYPLLAQKSPRVEQLTAQQRRETYVNRFGRDSIELIIAGQNDTISRKYFNDAQQLMRQHWRKDSFHLYDVFGQLREVYYLNDPIEQEGLYEPNISYYFNGELNKRNLIKPTGERVRELFQKDGALLRRDILYQRTPSVKYLAQMDSLGRKIFGGKIDSSAFLLDSTCRTYDTVFYTDGRILSVQYCKQYISRASYSELYKGTYYRKDGSLFMDVLPDSLILKPFIEAVNGYFGLKNRQGDTIYPSKFEELYNLSWNLWSPKQGTHFFMMRQDGKIMTQTPMDEIFAVNLRTDLGGLQSAGYKESDQLSFYQILQTYPQYFSFQLGDKFGLIDRQGTVILPPQYPRFIGQDAAAAFFEVLFSDTTSTTIMDNTRTIINRQGKYLFEKRFPYMELTERPNFFRFSNTIKTDTSQAFNVGLVNLSGEILLDAIYDNIDANPSTGLFWVAKGKETYDAFGQKEYWKPTYGLFDPVQKKWILPCIYHIGYQNGKSDPILRDGKTQKMGMVSASGQVLLPFIYDTIKQFMNTNTCAVVQNGRYQIYDDIKRQFNKEIYQYLEPKTIDCYQYYYSSVGEEGTIFFIAQKNNKWGLIGFDGKVIVPFIYDYVGNTTNSIIAMVKDNHADILTSGWLFPLPQPDNEAEREELGKSLNFFTFNLVGDTTKQTFAVDSNNRVLHPPQYKH